MLKRKGPNAEPWGTSDKIVKREQCLVPGFPKKVTNLIRATDENLA